MNNISEEDLQFFVNNINKLKKDPVLFAKHVLHINLHSGQKQVLSAVDDNRLLAIMCGRRWGKTFCFAVLGAWGAATHKNYRIVCLAPTERQSKELFQAISSIISGSILNSYIVQKSATKLKLSNGSTVEAVPGSSGANLRGMGVHLLLCDEASFITQSTFNAIYATIANVGTKTEGRLVAISTPGIRAGEFYKAFQEGSRYKTFNLSYNDAIYDNGKRHMPEEELEMFADICGGKDSAEFKREFLCEWGETDDAFFDVEGIEKSLSYNPEQIRYGLQDHTYFFGIDIGLTNDYTIIAVLDATDKSNLKIVRTVRFTGKTTDEIMDILYKEAIAFNPKNILIDDAKAGVAIITHLKLLYPNIKWTPFNFNVKSKTPLLYDLNMAMCTGILQLPDDPQLRDELISYCYTYSQSSGNLKLNGVGCHDDFPIAVALSIRSAQIFSRRSGFTIVSDRSTNIQDDDNDASNSPQIRRSTAKSLTF